MKKTLFMVVPILIITMVVLLSNNIVRANGGNTYSFTLNGKEFTDVSDGAMIVVDDNMNFNGINTLCFTKVVIGGTPYIYNNNEYCYTLKDDQDRTILEANLNKHSNSYATFRVRSHPEDILDSDLQGHERSYFADFYITNIGFKKAGFKGVEASTAIMPDHYDFTVWNGVDLNEGEGTLTAYYGDDTIILTSDCDSSINKVELVEGRGVPNHAVTITGNNVKINSSYYNIIPVRVTLEDNTSGIVNINRMGIYITNIPSGSDILYHGAELQIAQPNFTHNTGKDRIAATFYHTSAKSHTDYDIYANITYSNGTTETVIAEWVSDTTGAHGLVGSDYEIWAGDMANAPVKVSVIAANKNAAASETVFGGLTFGNGSGVEWTRRG